MAGSQHSFVLDLPCWSRASRESPSAALDEPATSVVKRQSLLPSHPSANATHAQLHRRRPHGGAQPALCCLQGWSLCPAQSLAECSSSRRETQQSLGSDRADPSRAPCPES